MRPPMPLGVVSAPPLWAISAEHSARRMVTLEAEREAAAAVEQFVTKHPVPWFGEPVTDGAKRMLELALSKGMTAKLTTDLDWCVVEGIHLEAGVAFRARWHRGRANLGAWHERTMRWGMVYDERPAHDVTVTRTVKGVAKRVPHPNRMPLGLERDHLVMLAGPMGIDVGVTEVTNRLKGMP